MRNRISCATLSAGLLAGLLMSAAPALAADAARSAFGALPDGRAVEAVTLSNGKGVTARVISYGAILQSLVAPDRDGKKADIVLGYADAATYQTVPNYFGATVGRYANRIAGGRFALDGKNYSLARNNGPNALHGGPVGFDKVVWKVIEVKSGPQASVTLGYTSPDGEEGYPGALSVTATYTLDESNNLSVDYRATTTRPTIVNITNHSFFNLAGEGSGRSILANRLTIAADSFTPVSAVLIPTGEIRSVAATPFDFRKATVIGDRIRDGREEQIRFGQGYDHNYVLGRTVSATPRLAARLEDPVSGRVVELSTNQPGVQLYTGNFLNGTAVGKAGTVYRQSDGIALEPQLFPDTPNHPAFGSARLDPGQTYHSQIIWHLTTSAR